MRIFRHYIPLDITIFTAGDLVILFAAPYLAIYIRFFQDPSLGFEIFQPVYVKALVFAIAYQFLFFMADVYEENGFRVKTFIVRFFGATLFAIPILASLYYFLPQVKLGRGVFAITFPLVLALTILFRFLYVKVLSLNIYEKVLLLRTNPFNDTLMPLLTGGMGNGYLLSDVVEIKPGRPDRESREKLIEKVRRGKIDKIILSLDERRGTLPVQELLQCRLMGVEVLEAPSVYEQLTGKIPLEQIKPSWLIFSDGFRISEHIRILKRLLDVVVAGVSLVIFAFPMALIAILIKLDSKGPVLFKQERVGEGGKVFTLIKFRTMRVDAEKDGPRWAQKDDPRVTRVGRILRRTRLDELPQLVNILKGDMSLVGPRPERPCFVEQLRQVIPYYDIRHYIKPGLTGWAQVKFGYTSSVEDSMEKVRYDLYYVKNMSIFLDILILFHTLKIILFGRGAK